MLTDGSRLPQQDQRLQEFYDKYHADEKRESLKHKSPVNSRAQYGLQPLLSMHTDMKITGGGTEQVNPGNVWLLVLIASGVLIIACINFTTLAIGRSAGRAREVGIRKVVGGSKKGLVIQFMAEAMLLSFTATILGCLLAILFLPWFNELSARELKFSFIQFPEYPWLLFGVMLLTGLFSGSYPSLVLSS